MHCLSPKMVCETKIVAEDHDTIPGSKKDTVIVSSSQMWPSLSGGSAPSPAPPMPPPSAAAAEVAGEDGKKEHVCIREFHPAEQDTVRRIFYDGIMERIPNTAFRGLKQQPFTQLMYVLLACSCFWVAVLDGNVVGIVAARGSEDDNTVELRRMSVDSRYRGKGIAKALGRKVLEFAMLNNYSSVVLGTTAVKVAAHKLYESLGFKHMGVVEHYVLPGMTHSLVEKMFFQLRYHRYRLQLREE
ncbi:N-acetylaspartate synthetase isoform X2 [Monodelphis domestica]|uniref:N-acetylaspartate synthetase isoform X2 n=1 Tax=Monodelphis domestica TaxID=13616 RepID=UPI0004432DE6|nr:N-acetylaspartate synthetase isoform X2 [Monodelphis domestica]